MSDNVTFEDYSISVKNTIKDICINFLDDAGNEVINQTIRNYDPVSDTGQTKGSFRHEVDEGNLVVHIGSDYPNAIWEEFGTGEFAEKGDGRKGWWVYVKGQTGQGKNPGGKVYSTKEQAKRAMRYLREQGLPAFYTRGKHARHQFRNAFNTMKPQIIRHAQELFGGLS